MGTLLGLGKSFEWKKFESYKKFNFLAPIFKGLYGTREATEMAEHSYTKYQNT